MKNVSAPALPGELLYGIRAIAGHLGITPRQALHLTEKGSLPFWKEGRTIVARRATVAAWIAEREAAGRQQAAK